MPSTSVVVAMVPIQPSFSALNLVFFGVRACRNTVDPSGMPIAEPSLGETLAM